jgi:hypothetical protein
MIAELHTVEYCKVVIAEHYFVALFLMLMSVFASLEELSIKMGVLTVQFLGFVI